MVRTGEGSDVGAKPGEEGVAFGFLLRPERGELGLAGGGEQRAFLGGAFADVLFVAPMAALLAVEAGGKLVNQTPGSRSETRPLAKMESDTSSSESCSNGGLSDVSDSIVASAAARSSSERVRKALRASLGSNPPRRGEAGSRGCSASLSRRRSI